MLRKIESSLIHQRPTQYPWYESTITTRDEPWFGELKLTLECNRTPSYCARSYTEVLPAGCWNDASRAGPRFRKMKGQKLVKNGEVHPNRPMKNKEESEAPMAREAHAERARRKKSVEEKKQPELIPFASWAQSSASLSWPNQGFGASCYAT
ncbi:hypothetical protein GBA52_028743 [Prunus armeniaca]|nr:hypothetical protein GBA52_028743 [Prunus armeniaca]